MVQATGNDAEMAENQAIAPWRSGQSSQWTPLDMLSVSISVSSLVTRFYIFNIPMHYTLFDNIEST